MIQIKKAVREQVFLKLVVTGASGAGKTYGALGLAKGLAPTGKVLVVDTENRSASYYSGRWEFDVIEMEAPFTTQKYNEALQAAIDGSYEVVVLDSLTHEWAGSGGLQDQKALRDARGGNSFTNWAEMKMAHNKFTEKLLQSKVHVVGTLRSKMSYVLEPDEKGKSTPRKIGMAPISADDMEYEFGVMFDVDRNSHLAVASKDRTGLFEGRSLNLDETVGKELARWLASGIVPSPLTASAPATAAPAMATPAAPAEKAPEPSPAIAAGAPQAQAGVPDKAPAKLEHTDRAAWDDAMADLAMVTRDMMPNTRSKLCQEWIKAGPEKLADLLREITALKDIQQPAPTNVGQVLQQLPAPAKLAVSTDVKDFADAVADGPDEPPGAIDPAQYMALDSFITNYKLNRDALRAYCAKLNYLLPGKNGPTLARLKATAFTKLREDLTNDTLAPGGKETWSQRRIRIINSTSPIFQPAIEAAS